MLFDKRQRLRKADAAEKRHPKMTSMTTGTWTNIGTGGSHKGSRNRATIMVAASQSAVEILMRVLMMPNGKLTDDEERAKCGRLGTETSSRSSSFGRALCSAMCLPKLHDIREEHVGEEY